MIVDPKYIIHSQNPARERRDERRRKAVWADPPGGNDVFGRHPPTNERGDAKRRRVGPLFGGGSARRGVGGAVCEGEISACTGRGAVETPSRRVAAGKFGPARKHALVQVWFRCATSAPPLAPLPLACQPMATMATPPPVPPADGDDMEVEEEDAQVKLAQVNQPSPPASRLTPCGLVC